ncbi:MAG TPA: MarR family winged helix-turn-helix transcriptional regulator [Amycolatopsis sp.]|nr:MarR family winged helix-turn-helix transcriptional regulator [Amycolatopsis sp.]
MGQGRADTAQERDESLAEDFRAVARMLRRAAAESLARWDVTPSQFRALRVLTRHGDMRPSALAEHLCIAPRSTTEVLDGLAAKGLIERRPDARDRRATLVGPTGHGRAVGEQISAARGSQSARFFEKLTPADRAELARILGELLD